MGHLSCLTTIRSTPSPPRKSEWYCKNHVGYYQQQGKLPVWHLMGNETDTMVGYHAVLVIVDAYLKGFGYDAWLMKQWNNRQCKNRWNWLRLPVYTCRKSCWVCGKSAGIRYWWIGLLRKYVKQWVKYLIINITQRSKLYKSILIKNWVYAQQNLRWFWQWAFSPLASNTIPWMTTPKVMPGNIHGWCRRCGRTDESFGSEKDSLQKLDSLFTVPAELDKARPISAA